MLKLLGASLAPTYPRGSMIASKPARGLRRPTNTNGSEPPKPWRERLQDVRTAYSNIPGAFKLVWSADRRSTIAMAVLTGMTER